MVTARRVRELIEERPDLEPAVEAVLEPDPPFTFDDLALDSGAFGELVARGVVERTGEGYRVADRTAVRRGLTGEVHVDAPDRPGFSTRLPTVDRLELVLLVGAVALVVAFRLLPLPTIYREGQIVLSSNDPYYYRYLVELLLADPTVGPSTLPSPVLKGEPLLVTTLWLATLALGGTVTVAGHVLAWYPIASAVVTALLLYAVAVVVTDDRRIGLAAVAMFAVIPAHAFRTSLGFADHHAFDYPWLVLTLLGVVLILRGARHGDRFRSGATAVATGAIAIGVAGQTLAWDNSPIILAALGGYLALEGLRTLTATDPPRRTLGPLVVGVLLGAAIAWLIHESLGWHTTLVASAPALLGIGGLGVLVGAEVVGRLERSLGDRSTRIHATAVTFGIAEALGLVFAALALRSLRPAFWKRLTTSLHGRLLAPRPIAEVEGLFADSGGWLLLLGFALFLALPYLVWATYQAIDDGRWLAPAAFAWYFLVLSTIQVRFVGELAPILSLFAGLGLVHLAERIDVARRPAPFTEGEPPALTLPEPRQLGALVLLFLLVGSLGIVQVPVKTSQVTVPPAQSDAAFWMAEYSDDHGVAYPSNYVFSEWGWNRMYNYFVNGESRSYAYAQSNFQSFLTSTRPAEWYDRLGDRRGYVVTTPDAIGGARQLGTRLHRDNGAGSETTGALAHYRLVHVTGGGDFKVFTVVPGAIIEGTATPNTSVTARTQVNVGDEAFVYERTVTADADGQFRARVAHPGTYQVGEATPRVNQSAVRNGTVVRTT